MTGRFPAVDLHAHIDASITAAELTHLTGIVFAASRTFAESETALKRSDPRVLWGAGCHPGLARNHTSFDAARFEEQIQRTPYVGEIGLDGSSKGGLTRQIVTFDKILGILLRHPRLTSIHSHGAHDEILAALQRRPIHGAILHWWLGTPEQTRQAVKLGCYFSMNIKAIKRTEAMDEIPLDRVLPETDHPFGDSTSKQPRMPGNTATAEINLASHYGTSQAQIRATVWTNLSRLVTETECSRLMNRTLISYLAAAG
jgi:TatD DNase family protein